jgi:hypothetical protein
MWRENATKTRRRGCGGIAERGVVRDLESSLFASPLGPSNQHRGSWGAGYTPESSGCGEKTRLKQGKRVAGELSKVEWCGTWKVVTLCCQNDVFHLTNFEILIESCRWENFDNFRRFDNINLGIFDLFYSVTSSRP